MILKQMIQFTVVKEKGIIAYIGKSEVVTPVTQFEPKVRRDENEQSPKKKTAQEFV